MPRNIIVLLCDQLRPDFLNIYGGEGIPTPNIEALARRGTTYDRAIAASPVCGPCRACMMTGERIDSHGVWTNDIPFRPGVEFIAERMNQLGYRTGAFGKMHHTPADDPKGFHECHFMEEGRLGERDPYYRWLKERHPEAEDIFNLNGHAFAFDDEDYYERWIADHAIDWIARDNERKPFFAWISFQGPHGPHDPPPSARGTVDPEKLPLAPPPETVSPASSVDTYRTALFGTSDKSPAELQAMRTAYAETLVAIDTEIGRILAALDASGQADQTTILFSADHGDLLGDYGRDQKGPYPWQAQLGVPLVLAHHPDIPTGSRSNLLCGNIDIPGTILDIAGDSRPIGVSRSLLHLPEAPRTYNFSEFCDTMKLVESDKFRFAYYPFSGERTLYRREDPHWIESENLSGRPEFATIEIQHFAALIDALLFSKGPRIEAQDCNPIVQRGLDTLHPDWKHRYPIAFPLHKDARKQRLRDHGLDADYNDFCNDAVILSKY